MLDEKDLQAIAQLMDRKLEPIKKDLKELKEDVEAIKEELEVVHVATDRLCAWTDEMNDALPFPTPKL